MSNQPPSDDPVPQALPEAVVDERRRVSLVWLIPLVTLVAALWLGYHTFRQQGPLVTVTFDTAEGLEAGKTRLRYKDVDVGVVESIELSPDLSQVLVHARVDRDLEPWLTEGSRFWVARPRVSRGQVTGLTTLVGGTYIGVDLAREGSPQRRFVGLETPPLVAAEDRGRSFVLEAAALGGIGEGSPVLYRGIEVGRVVGYRLGADDRIDIQIFVEAPHDARVTRATRFWNSSGVGLALDARGVRLESDSLAAVLLGGIAFGQAAGAGPAETAAPGERFPLYAGEDAAFEPVFAERELWQVNFAGSVRGLLPGAPVELRGIRVGEVIDVRLQLDGDAGLTEIPVTLAIEPGRLGMEPGSDHRAVWDGLVERGLRAQLKTGNLLSGALFVDLDFYPDDPPRGIDWAAATPRLPSVPTALDELRAVLGRIARLPLDRMGEDLAQSLAALRDTMRATNTLLARLDRETAGELTQTLEQTRATLASLDRLLKPNSPLQTDASRAFQELAAAARSLRIMADYLERHPEALIRGKGGATP